MRYIEQVLQPGETVVYAGRLHWIVYLPAAIAFVLSLAALSLAMRSRANATELSWLFVSLAGVGAGAVLAFSAWFRRWTTELGVTDRRIIYKRGFIRRHTVEMNMSAVESVDVDQSMAGRFLDYGDIIIHGTGEGIEPLRGIGRPLQFRNRVTAC